MGESDARAGITGIPQRDGQLDNKRHVENSGGRHNARQRQNAASALSRGLEADALRKYGAIFAGQVSLYMYVDSQLVTGPLAAAGAAPPGVGAGDVPAQGHAGGASMGVRSFSYQFDDDLNAFRLPGFAAVELAVVQKLKGGLSARGSIENLLDHQYLTGLTPTPTIGSPRTTVSRRPYAGKTDSSATDLKRHLGPRIAGDLFYTETVGQRLLPHVARLFRWRRAWTYGVA